MSITVKNDDYIVVYLSPKQRVRLGLKLLFWPWELEISYKERLIMGIEYLFAWTKQVYAFKKAEAPDASQ